MDPITLISGAISIADAVGLDEWFGELVGGEPGAKAASKVVNVAKQFTGKSSVEDILSVIKENEVFAKELRVELMNNEHALKMAAFADRQSAREMYQSTDHEMADTIAASVFRLNPLLIILLVALNAAVIMYVENPTIAVSVGNVIGFSIGQLWQERQAVINFFFGSSHGSKQKTAAMQKLANG